MDKFTMYEFMSYFLPGVIALFAIRIFIHLDYSFLELHSQLEQGLAFSIAAVLLGLFNHRLTVWLSNFKWYKKIIMTPIKSIVKKNRENLKDDYVQLKTLLKENDEGQIFDKAYYYLEYKERISSVKGFQSMFFFIRNLITLVLLILLAVTRLFFVNTQINNRILLFLFVACILGIIVLIWMGKWYREKLVIKVYKTCLVALTIKDKNSTNED